MARKKKGNKNTSARPKQNLPQSSLSAFLSSSNTNNADDTDDTEKPLHPITVSLRDNTIVMGRIVLGCLPQDDVCVNCGDHHPNKFETSLMCANGHMTCFHCVAVGVQPHVMCSGSCNGMKYRCQLCETWSCVNKTQELAMLCGSHRVARERLIRERIAPADFERPRICVCTDDSESVQSTSDTSQDTDTDEDCDHKRFGSYHGDLCTTKLPRIYNIDWSQGQEQRAKRLARLKKNLLTHRSM